MKLLLNIILLFLLIGCVNDDIKDSPNQQVPSDLEIPDLQNPPTLVFNYVQYTNKLVDSLVGLYADSINNLDMNHVPIFLSDACIEYSLQQQDNSTFFIYPIKKRIADKITNKENLEVVLNLDIEGINKCCRIKQSFAPYIKIYL